MAEITARLVAPALARLRDASASEGVSVRSLLEATAICYLELIDTERGVAELHQWMHAQAVRADEDAAGTVVRLKFNNRMEDSVLDGIRQVCQQQGITFNGFLTAVFTPDTPKSKPAQVARERLESSTIATARRIDHQRRMNLPPDYHCVCTD